MRMLLPRLFHLSSGGDGRMKDPEPVLAGALPLVDLESALDVLSELIDTVPGVQGVHRIRIDQGGSLRMRIGVLPERGYRKVGRFRKLQGRIAALAGRQTGIPQDRILVQRNLKPLPRSRSP